MKQRMLGISVWFCLLALAGAPALAAPTADNLQPAAAPDLLIKIRHVDQLLDLVDDLSQDFVKPSAAKPSAMLRGMLQGTDWIDPGRLIVIGVDLQAPKPRAVVLIPYQRPNDNFKNAFRAVASGQAYLLPLPPASGAVVPPGFQAALRRASTAGAANALTFEVAAARLLDKKSNQIRAMLDQKLKSPRLPAGELAIPPAETAATLSQMVDTLKQLKAFSVGIDLDKTRLQVRFEARALPGTELDRLFRKPGGTLLLNRYHPPQPMTFHSGNYDIARMMRLFTRLFGRVYQRIGMDIGGIAKIAEHMTGETAGGISYTTDPVSFEMISVLKDARSAQKFLTSEYIPWMIAYGRQMTAILEKQTGEKVPSVVTQTPATKVDGHRVFGFRFKAPLTPPVNGGSRPGMSPAFIDYQVRITTAGRMLLIAPDDQRIAQLIRIAGTSKPEPAQPPLMRADFDTSQYLTLVSRQMAHSADSPLPPLPKTGKVQFNMDVKAGTAVSSFAIAVNDIKNMTAYTQNLKHRKTFKGAPQHLPQTTAKQSARPESAAVKHKPRVQTPEMRARKWFEKGAICAAYGNHKGALRYFNKALALSPKSSAVHFERGICYGELGDFDRAVAAIDRAIALRPDRALYYYGRGRVYLLAGNRDRALEDFKRAASGGNPDARAYLAQTAVAAAGK